MNRKKCILYGVIISILLLVTVLGILFLNEKETVFCNVTFPDFDGTILKTEAVKYGEVASAPVDSQREGYPFTGWNKGPSIVKDTVITAEYIRITETTFTVNTITVASDIKKAEIKAWVANNPGILGMLVSLEYDENALKLVDSKTFWNCLL